MKGFLNYLNRPKIFIQALYEKVKENATKAGQSVKTYLADEKNIHHISLVAYDLMPLTVKIGLRHEKFYEHFLKVFKLIRNQLFTYEEELSNNDTSALSSSKLKEKHLTMITVHMNMLLDNALRDQAFSKNISKDDLLQHYLDTGMKVAKKLLYSEKTVSEQVNANVNTTLRTLTIGVDINQQLSNEAISKKINKHLLLQGYVILGMQAEQDSITNKSIKKVPVKKIAAKKSPARKTVVAKKSVKPKN